MVLVPKFPPIPRLSIIVPIGPDVSAFEATLVSVLENRPRQCEIIVPHDGRYDDPFELSDEVRFVVVAGGNFVDQVMAGARAAQGHFLHILADGLRATEGWADSALEKFEHHDAAVVVPVVRRTDQNRIVSAGWCDTSRQLLQPVASGQAEVSAMDATIQFGAFLQASFWRRSVFLSLGDAFLYDGAHDSESVTEAAYVFQHLLRQAGWQSVLAAECDVLSDQYTMVGKDASIDRGRRLGAAKRHFDAAGSSMSLWGLVKALIGSVIRRGEYGQWYGRATSGRRMTALKKRLRPEVVQRREHHDVVMVKPTPETQPLRRAA